MSKGQPPYAVSSVTLTGEYPTPLHGRLYVPHTAHATSPCPAVILTQGFGALQSHHLPELAAALARNNIIALTYDHRHFGDSGHPPTQAVRPLAQRNDMRHAIDTLLTYPYVKQHHIGVWGNSLSAGHILSLCASPSPPPIQCVFAQTPFLSGTHSLQYSGLYQQWSHLSRLLEKDQARQHANKSPLRLPIRLLFSHEPDFPHFFYTVPHWRDTVTLDSLPPTFSYEPILPLLEKAHIRQYGITPPPVLPPPVKTGPFPALCMLIAEQDRITSPCLQHTLWEKWPTANKQQYRLKGGHFSPYHSQYKMHAQCLAVNWFTTQLCKNK